MENPGNRVEAACGWPYGGPFIAVNRAARCLRVLTRTVAGLEPFSWDLTVEASLNSTALGAAWKGARQLKCRAALKAGRNQLAVRVGNLWVNNYYTRPKRNLKLVAETLGIRRGTSGEIPPKTMPPSGLLGPVRLLPLRRRTEKW